MNPTEQEFRDCDGLRARENLLEKKLLKLGVRGVPMFSELSYFKYAVIDLCMDCMCCTRAVEVNVTCASQVSSPVRGLLTP